MQTMVDICTLHIYIMQKGTQWAKQTERERETEPATAKAKSDRDSDGHEPVSERARGEQINQERKKGKKTHWNAKHKKWQRCFHKNYCGISIWPRATQSEFVMLNIECNVRDFRVCECFAFNFFSVDHFCVLILIFCNLIKYLILISVELFTFKFGILVLRFRIRCINTVSCMLCIFIIKLKNCFAQPLAHHHRL